jgi:signal transduction histidine kinase
MICKLLIERPRLTEIKLPFCHRRRIELNGKNKTGSCYCLNWFCYLALLLSGIGIFYTAQAADSVTNQLWQTLTNVSQFSGPFGEDAESKCRFSLNGIVTMVDTNRQLFVLQDETGAMAVNMDMRNYSLQPGQLVSLQGTGAAPYFVSFPDYPYWPTGWDIRDSFEGPTNWGEYNLTRMRGYLHPPFTGLYTFWIASDNSSELWLSTSEDRAQIKRIAFVKEGNWVNPHEWSRYPSQHSDAIYLSSDKTYYIEALQEQLLLNENLAVAWEGPGFNQTVIDEHYLTPWIENPDQIPSVGTNGVLREYWTNYTLGFVSGLTGRRQLNFALTLKRAQLTIQGQGTWPEPLHVSLDGPLPVENNYNWVQVQGAISFIGTSGESATLELTDGQNRTQVKVSNWKDSLTRRFQNRLVSIKGVCEGMQTANGYLVPGLIWTPDENYISFIQATETNHTPGTLWSLNRLAEALSATRPTWSDFFSVRGVVTLNDQVLGRDCLYIQNEADGFFISHSGHDLSQLHVGQWVNVGGNLVSDKFGPRLNPDDITILGWRPMPTPITQPVEIPAITSRNGQWTELEGLVRSVNPNGTIEMMGKGGLISVWIGQTPKETLNRYVDSRVRLRGVLSVETPDSPMLLVPSRSYVEVLEESPSDPFAIPTITTTELNSTNNEVSLQHRVKVEGTITYLNDRTLIVQDEFGGAQIETESSPAVHIGDKVEVVGFHDDGRSIPLLTRSLVRAVATGSPLLPQKLNLNKTILNTYCGTLVRLNATLLAQKAMGGDQVLDLQGGQHIFEAVLAEGHGTLVSRAAGSLLEITGILDVENEVSADRHARQEGVPLESMKILLNSPQDAVLLADPPWWTWKGVIVLTCILLAVMTVGLLVIYLLRQRLARQQAAQFFFSSQILKSQEDERRRIAVNLHDTLGQNLLVIKNQSRLAIQSPADESVLKHRLDEISEVASQAIEEVRQITRNLRPYQLDRLGLTQTIRATIKQVSENSPIMFANHVDEIDGIFDKESEIHIYRILQESINNIIKHSGATEATIVVKRQTSVVAMSIRDNGRGFDATQAESSGFGLTGIKERVWILGGKSTVVSMPGQGVNLTFEIPAANS